jgi:hypothetical protein
MPRALVDCWRAEACKLNLTGAERMRFGHKCESNEIKRNPSQSRSESVTLAQEYCSRGFQWV